MKKLLLAIAIMLSFVLPSNAFTVVHKDMGTVSVNSEATKEVMPDAASIIFTVETFSKDSKTAVQLNNEKTTKLIDSVKPLLLLDKTDSIQTRNFSLRPNYNYDSKTGKKSFQNYAVSNSIMVKTKNLENVSKLIDTAVANDVNIAHQLTFYIENEKQYYGEIAQEAIRKAKILANFTASALDQKVCGVKAIRVSIYPQTMYSRDVRAAVAPKASNKQVPVEFGKIKLQANVSADFYVK